MVYSWECCYFVQNVSQDISELEITCFMGDSVMLFTSSVKTLVSF